MVIAPRADADRRSEMRLACAVVADQDDILIFLALSAMELTCERFRADGRAAGEVYPGEIAIVLEATALSNRPSFSLSFGRLRLQELRQDRHGDLKPAGEPCSVSSPTGRAMPCILRSRSMMMIAPAVLIMTHGAPGLGAGRRALDVGLRLCGERQALGGFTAGGQGSACRRSGWQHIQNMGLRRRAGLPAPVRRRRARPARVMLENQGQISTISRGRRPAS